MSPDYSRQTGSNVTSAPSTLTTVKSRDPVAISQLQNKLKKKGCAEPQEGRIADYVCHCSQDDTATECGINVQALQYERNAESGQCGDE